ncbi:MULTISPECIES: bestrophin family protein [unclassified Rhizobium]|uniref:bestrophin family protein n=1 Tax=unclassified Rhizobium TaxID=2613769 RepID=UPI00247A9E49|nr:MULTISPECIES: bestrophin family protein [unclassified Rhizobium]MDH7800165.1 putative membrane protein [Rhizobium sp. AN70]
MIVRPKPNLLQLFVIVRGSIIVRIFPQVLAVFLLSTLVVWAHKDRPDLVQALNGAPFSLMGIALSVFLGFRANACYDRWWEARKQWGALITVARTLARQSALLESRTDVADPVSRRRIIDLAIVFSHELVSHLRPGEAKPTVASLIPDDVAENYAHSRNKPEMLLRAISSDLFAANAKGQISDIQLQMLDATVQQMGAALASCERIRHTPVAFGYSLLLHRTAHLFCLLLPFGFTDLLGWATPFTSTLIAYTLFGLDALSDELEEPFGSGLNALPINSLATVIEINLREAMGETDLPANPRPVDYVLM